MQSFVPAEEIRIGSARPVPAFIFHEGVVSTEIHRYVGSIVRMLRDQRRRNFHGNTACRHFKDPLRILYKPLGFHGLHHPGFIVNGLPVCRICALEQAVVALRIEEPLFVKACLLETVIHVGGDHEIILILYQRIQVLINGSRRIHAAVHVNISCPESPSGLRIRIRVESAGIHIPYAKTCGEV